MPGLRWTGLAGCLWSALLLPACGGGDSSSNTVPAGAAPAESATAAPAVSPAAGPATAVSAGGQPTVAAPAPATSADALAGRVLFRDNCQICHGIPPDRRVIGAAGDPLAVLQSVNTIRPMLFLARAITITESTHIAAWLQDPR